MTEAKKEARRTLDALLPYVRRGIPVIGLEPSCLLTMRDEFMVYSMGPDAELLSKNAFLFEEFLAREQRAGTLHLQLKALPQKTAPLHGHCHKKAFDAVKPIEVVLGLIPDLKVNWPDASRCLVGSAGFEPAYFGACRASRSTTELSAMS